MLKIHTPLLPTPLRPCLPSGLGAGGTETTGEGSTQPPSCGSSSCTRILVVEVGENGEALKSGYELARLLLNPAPTGEASGGSSSGSCVARARSRACWMAASLSLGAAHVSCACKSAAASLAALAVG